MRYLRISIPVMLLLAAAISSADDSSGTKIDASDQPPEKSTAKPARRLKGEFKGHPVAPPDKSDSGDQKQLPATPAPPPKPLMIDNRLVGVPVLAKKPKESASPSVPRSASEIRPAVVSHAPPPTPVAGSPEPRAASPFGPVDLNGNGEGYWRQRAKQARQRLAMATQTLEAAQLEEKREENDFYAWDDGQYRDSVIKPAWDKSKEEAVHAQDEVDAAKKGVEDLEDDARKAGAYPGWIRE